jgi:transcriptional regulator with XRE-family HTH domain
MDEELVETDVPTVGERLRAAREEKGLRLEDIAAQTRIPQRHLEAIETSEWDKLPAPTYTTGFAKSYASAVGLDRTEIGEQLRAELGGTRPVAAAEVFEPADPARTMPKWLVFGGIAAVILLVVVMSWLNRRSLDQPDDAATNTPAAAATAPSQTPVPSPAPVAVAQGPVVLNAIEPVWLQVYQRGGATLFSGTLQPGQTFAVPQTASAPLLKTGKPEALRINVGNGVAPPVGPPATTVRDVSLLAADLIKGGNAAAPAPQAAAPAPATRPRPADLARPSATALPSSPVAEAPAEAATNTGE